MSKLRRDIRLLKVYCLFSTAIIAILLLSGFVQTENKRFSEIDVERINVVERNGDLKMVISNRERQHPGKVDGIEFDRPRPPGIIFFNDLGDETGGLIFGGEDEEGHNASLTFDKIRNDQTMGFRHLEDANGNYQSALEMWQQPMISLREVLEVRKRIEAITDPVKRQVAIEEALDAGHLPTTRMFLGKRPDNSTELVMSDERSRPRLKLRVDAEGKPGLEFLDEAGRVTAKFP